MPITPEKRKDNEAKLKPLIDYYKSIDRDDVAENLANLECEVVDAPSRKTLRSKLIGSFGWYEKDYWSKLHDELINKGL